ncbi:MAG TPA: glycosyl hydrolase family 28 protein [Sedimentisphaerales bacterium]|nr:glycosyl hydrolase family 28 protein [Sedimentisphaerales bacterium]
MSRTKCRISTGLLCLLTAACVFGADNVYDVRDYGARPDGKTLCTKSIQKAIDECAERGGGTVYLPPGRWLTGTVYLADNVTIELENGCTILGTTDKSQYGPPRQLLGAEGEQYSTWAIFAGKGLRSIAIRGRGTIDGQGSHFKYKNGARPKNLYFEDCQDVLIEGVRLRSAGSWMQHYRDCDRLTIRDIAVFNHVSYNNDGLNIDSCRDVTIVGCMIDSDDDAIVLKSLSTKPTENVTISDCVISSHCNAIKMGTESGGGFRNITVSNCTICSPRYSRKIYGRQRGLAGVALEIVDGGTLDRVAISNLTIKGVTVPIFMRLGNRARTYGPDQPRPDVGIFRNVVVSNIIATDCFPVGCSITGLPGHSIENVTLSNISLDFEGGGSREDAKREIPEKPDSYPESTMFGTLPAYGFFCRHARDLRLHNVRVHTSTPDLRHAIVLDDVEDALIDSLDATFSAGASSMVRLTNIKGAFIRGCRPRTGTDTFLKLEGEASEGVVLVANDLSRVRRVVEMTSDVPKAALAKIANHVEQKSRKD